MALGCVIGLIVIAVAGVFDWALAQLLIFAASKVFGFETNIYQVLLVFIAIIVLESIFKSGRSTKED